MAERPGLRPEKRVEYRFGERQTPRAAGFPEACVGWPCSGLTAAPPAGRLPDEAVLERPGYPPRSSTPAGRPLGGHRNRSGLPACAARSRSIRSRRRFGSPAERASLATGREESPTGPGYGGLGTLHFLEDERNPRVGGAGSADNRRIVRKQLPSHLDGEGSALWPVARGCFRPLADLGWIIA